MSTTFLDFDRALAQLDPLYGDTDKFIVNRWLWSWKTSVYYVVWTDRWCWFPINANQIIAPVFYDLLRLLRITPGAFPYVKDHPQFWHVETADSFFDYLRDHLTTKGNFKKCI